MSRFIMTLNDKIPLYFSILMLKYRGNFNIFTRFHGMMHKGHIDEGAWFMWSTIGLQAVQSAPAVLLSTPIYRYLYGNGYALCIDPERVQLCH